MGQVINANYIIDIMWDMKLNQFYMMELIAVYPP